MVGDVMAHRVGCGGSLVGDEVNHLINDKGCDGSLVGDVVAPWLRMWWLLGWGCDGSLVEDVVAPRLGM